MDNDLATALEHHRAGLLDPARRMYQGLLARQPDHADALHLLGVLEHHHGVVFERLSQGTGSQPGEIRGEGKNNRR